MEHIDIIPLISSYLAPIVNYFLCQTWKILNKYVDTKQIILREINYRLRSIFGSKLTNFKEHMQKVGAVIYHSMYVE